MCFCSKCCGKMEGISPQPRGAWEKNWRQRHLKDLLKDKTHLEAGKRGPWGRGSSTGKRSEAWLCTHSRNRRAVAGQHGVCYRGKGRGWERCRGLVWAQAQKVLRLGLLPMASEHREEPLNVVHIKCAIWCCLCHLFQGLRKLIHFPTVFAQS